jgi:hypothetical protein
LHHKLQTEPLNVKLQPIQKLVSLMNEVHLQDRSLITFFRNRLDCKKVKANTAIQSLTIKDALQGTICLRN